MAFFVHIVLIHFLRGLGLGAMVSVFHQKLNVASSGSGISLSKKIIGRKAAYQLALLDLAKEGVLCTRYEHFF